MSNKAYTNFPTAATLADLQNYYSVPLDEGTLVFVIQQKCYYSLEKTAPLPPIDGFDVIAPLHQGGVWVRQNTSGSASTASFWNVKDFGAQGDGTTDDSPAVRAAYAAAKAAGGGIVYFPDGTYLFFTTVTINSNVQLIGAGQGSSIIHTKAGIVAFTQVDPWANPSEGSQYFLMFGLTVGGSTGTPVSAIDASGLTSFNAGLWLIDSCEIINTSGPAFILANSLYYSKFKDVQFSENFENVRVGSNTETIFEHCVFQQSGAGTYGVELNGTQHILFDRCEFYGQPPNNNPDVLVNPNADLGTGFVYWRDCKFGGERETWLSSLRNRVVVSSSVQAKYSSIRLVMRGCELFGPGLIQLISIGRSGGTATATTQCFTTSGHGLRTGDVIVVVQVSDSSFNFDTVTVTGVGPVGIQQTFSYANAGGNVGQSNRGGFVGSLSTAAIGLTSNVADFVVEETLAQNYGYVIDDSQSQANDVRGLGGMSFWGPSNRVVGPLGFKCQVFKSGVGRGFGHVNIEQNDLLQNIRRGESRIIELPQLRNRLPWSRNFANWGNNNTTVTPGITDPYGGTTATKIARKGLGVVTEGAFHTFGATEALVQGIDTTGSPTILWGRFWAQADTSSNLFFGVLDGNGFFQPQLNVPLSTTWQQYEVCCPLNATYPSIEVVIAAGGVDPQMGAINVWDFQFADFPGSPIVTTTGAAFLDNGAGSLIQQNMYMQALTASQAVVTNGSNKLVSLQYTPLTVVSTLMSRDANGFTAIAGLQNSGGTVPSVLNTTPVGAGGTFSLQAGSTSMGGVILINAGTGPGNTGLVRLTGLGPLPGNSPNFQCAPADGANGVWGNTPNVHVKGAVPGTYNSTVDFGFVNGTNWVATNFGASTSDVARINYWVVMQ